MAYNGQQQLAQQQLSGLANMAQSIFPPVSITPVYAASPSYTQTEEDNDSWIKKASFKILDTVFKRKETHEKEEGDQAQNS